MTQPVRDEDDRDDEKINTIILGMQGMPWMTQNAILYKENGEPNTWKEEDKNEEATLTMHGWELADYIREAISELEDTQDLLREARDVLLAEQETSSPWQPIETAPKDGTRIDAWVINDAAGFTIGRLTNIRWIDGRWVQGGRDDDLWDVEAPIFVKTGKPVVRITHWMPLPNPPAP